MEAMDLLDLVCWGAFLGVTVRTVLGLEVGVFFAAVVGAALAVGNSATVTLPGGVAPYAAVFAIGFIAYRFRHRFGLSGQRATNPMLLRQASLSSRGR